MGPSNHAVVAALGLVLAGCSILTDTSDLTFGQTASSVTVSSTGGASATSSVSTSGTSTGGGASSTGAGGCTAALPSGNWKRVFVTSATYQGDLDNLGPGDPVEDADAECALLAARACLEGQWKAWLSAAGKEPALTFSDSGLPYVTMNGATIGSGPTNIINLGAPINRDEHNGLVDNTYAWTGTNGAGTSANVHCVASGEWKASDAITEGIAGDVDLVGQEWSNARQANCDELYHLYCFEQ